MPGSSPRPLSPHLQVYRPQLTSVLSFAHRLTGVTLSVYALALVAWLIAAAAGPYPYFLIQSFLHSWPGETLLVAGMFCFFLHLCGGIRHLFWDAGQGFELHTIYASGWWVVIVSIVLTGSAWIASLFLAK